MIRLSRVFSIAPNSTRSTRRPKRENLQAAHPLTARQRGDLLTMSVYERVHGNISSMRSLPRLTERSSGLIVEFPADFRAIDYRQNFFPGSRVK
jgi:hypothetical protein